MDVDTDRELGSKYLLHEVIGRGATGQVFAGTARATGGPVAIKVLRPELVSDPEAVARFMQERQILTSVSSPATVRVIDLVAEGQTLAIVMELISGQDLRRYLRAKGTLPPAEAACLAVQLLTGLAAVHAAGVVHRDIKPENLMLDTSASEMTLKVTDFGVARLSYGASLTKLSSLIGTPEYMAPELAEGGSASPAADLYSAGVVLYEMLSGRTPFAGGAPMAVLRRHADMAPPPVPGVPDALWEQLSKMLAKDPADRPASAADAAGALIGQAAALAPLSALPPMTAPDSYQRPALAGPGLPDGSGTTVVRHRERAIGTDPGAMVPPRSASGSSRSTARWRRAALLAVAAAVIAAAAIVIPSWLRHKPSAPPHPQAYSFAQQSPGTPTASATPARHTPTTPAGRTSTAGAVTSAIPVAAPAAVAPSPAREGQQTAPKAQAYASSSLVTGSSSVTARVYFGQLSTVVSALSGQVTFNTSASLQAAKPGLCVGTVVFSQVTNPTGAVFAEGLGSGWTAAENAPSQDTESGNLHQQLVVPPAGASAAQSWQASAELTAGSLTVQSGGYSLTLQHQDGPTQTWLVNGQTVECTA